ncbi:unnamed protein product [Heterobilharzia americana]|nr:unnamed protein product [Heterobilharzia americana]
MALSRMSFGLLSLKQLVINPCRRPISINCRLSGLFAMSVLHPVLPKSFIFPHNLPTSTTPKLYVPCRRSTVFSSYSGDMLWEGVTGPKGGSKRRARGKRRVTRQKIDLNKGQKIGIGKASIQWPGLNASMSNPLIKQGVYDKDYFDG